ncbi:hypothetical protein LFE_2184 [Leptospirillum ferrooxidans C2-3]|uniref:Uncharacterized protein n=1 Tax=Leptospirillum ferrooxidans (strain C2-3) TaxID=1162668 RepID=I0IRF8_LEPFC|nr:hypothetical protein LFE_2184 [Leptospirillum ferrooxidans C2-3]
MDRIPERGSQEMEIPGPGISENGSGKRTKFTGWPFHGEAASMMTEPRSDRAPNGKRSLKDMFSSFLRKKTTAPPRKGTRGIRRRMIGRTPNGLVMMQKKRN